MPTTINSNYSLYTDTTKKPVIRIKKKNEKSIIEKVQDATGIKTDRGTRIIKKGQDLDKKCFF